MEATSKLERAILKWLKNVPHLPEAARQWLGNNVWWIVVIGVVLTGISALVLVGGVFGALATLSGPFVAYYASATFVMWALVTTIVSLVYAVLECIILGMAIGPLKAKQKKGWVLLFAAWLLSAVFVVVNAILTLNPFSFITSIIFGAIGLAVAGYFIFEIHGQFAHVERSKGVKAGK